MDDSGFRMVKARTKFTAGENAKFDRGGFTWRIQK